MNKAEATERLVRWARKNDVAPPSILECCDPAAVSADEALLKSVEEFLYSVGYRKWKDTAVEVAAKRPTGDKWHCGTKPFAKLAKAAKLRRAEG